MISFVYHYIVCMLVMLVFDIVWLASTINFFYKKHIGHLMTNNFVAPAAIAFYLIYIFGITFFVVHPGVQGFKTKSEVLIHGALFGLVAYATYDLTNHAVMKDWPAIVTIVDMIWGAFMTGSTSIISLYVVNYLGK